MLALLLIAIGVPAATSRAADLVVEAFETVQLGAPGVTTNHAFNSVHIKSGGRLEVSGTLTLDVVGDVVVDGSIFSLPTAKLTDGDPGKDGADGIDFLPVGQNVGGNGTAGERGDSWLISGTVLTINSQGRVVVDGDITLRTKLDGGDGGRGGHGGRGGAGSKPTTNFPRGGEGGGGGSAGGGATGGRPGRASTVRVTAGESISIGESGWISLDNLGAGGNGGEGGNGGDGGAGADGIDSGVGGDGGLGGISGSGGGGHPGGDGGTLTLRAPMLSLLGIISLTGGPGGAGGRAGVPSYGGNGGNAGQDLTTFGGGDGGNSGQWEFPFSQGGDGGRGGVGGYLYLDSDLVINPGSIFVSGGVGGSGGDGFEPRAGLGGEAGTPNGSAGEDSVAVPAGEGGAPGPAGAVYYRNPWLSVPNNKFLFGVPWLNTGLPGAATREFSDGEFASLQLNAHTAPAAIYAVVDTTSNGPLELILKHRWLTTDGSVDVVLGNTTILHLEAPTALSSGPTESRVLISDPALLNIGNQTLRLTLTPGSRAGLEIATFAIVDHPNRLTITRSATPGEVDLSWFGVEGSSYQLESRSPLPGAAWRPLGGVESGAGATITVGHPIDAQKSIEVFRLSIMMGGTGLVEGTHRDRTPMPADVGNPTGCHPQ